MIEEQRTQAFLTSRWGRFTKSIDGALPRRHVIQLYEDLPRKEAQILLQLQSGHRKLASYMARMHLMDSPNCDRCQELETVTHFLLRCKKWNEERIELRQAAGTRWGDLSYLLGGWSDFRDVTGRLVDGNKEQ